VDKPVFFIEMPELTDEQYAAVQILFGILLKHLKRNISINYNDIIGGRLLTI
jgi:hypothetical protein